MKFGICRQLKQQDIFNTPASVLDIKQREFYFAQGYLAFPGLIGNDVLDPLQSALADIVEQTKTLKQSTREVDLEPDHSPANPKLRRVAYLDDRDPVFWQLCSESVIPDIAADLLGPNIRFRELMMNFKWADGGAEVKWHQDIVFYPHTHSGTLQFLVMLKDTGYEQAPLQVIPESHHGKIYEHYDDNRRWTGAISDVDLVDIPLHNAVSMVGSAGSVSVHHSCTIHGSARNLSATGRPAFIITYSAADAIPYTAPAYPSSRYRNLVRGCEPRFAHHEELMVPLPPDLGRTAIRQFLPIRIANRNDCIGCCQ